ncbi:uncharacterized protein [Lolium perenne]|uniref:uncharacterized protein isoform X1 n=1 Tax=Lolium perenne TaxID=4522 RepID=UPI003A98F5A3
MVRIEGGDLGPAEWSSFPQRARDILRLSGNTSKCMDLMRPKARAFMSKDSIVFYGDREVKRGSDVPAKPEISPPRCILARKDSGREDQRSDFSVTVLQIGDECVDSEPIKVDLRAKFQAKGHEREYFYSLGGSVFSIHLYSAARLCFHSSLHSPMATSSKVNLGEKGGSARALVIAGAPATTVEQQSTRREGKAIMPAPSEVEMAVIVNMDAAFRAVKGWLVVGRLISAYRANPKAIIDGLKPVWRLHGEAEVQRTASHDDRFIVKFQAVAWRTLDAQG